MNYIKEINAFYDQVERNPLSASAVTLWHTLMHINNKARWIETFTVAAPVIRMKSGLKESSFKRARTELKEKGYIDFQSRSRNQAPVYRMVRLAVEYDAGSITGESGELEEAGSTREKSMERSTSAGSISDVDYMAAARGVDGIHTRNVEAEDLSQAADAGHIGSERKVAPHSNAVSSSQHPDPHSDIPSNQATGRSTDEGMDHLVDQDASPLIKQKENKKKKENTNTADRVIAFFKENFGVASPYVSGELVRWVSHSGEELVLHAMKRALDRGKVSWGYVRAILESWREKGICSVEEARAEEVRFRREGLSRKGIVSYGSRQAKEEVVPEWFREQKRKKKEQEHTHETVLPSHVDKKTEEIKQMLANFG